MKWISTNTDWVFLKTRRSRPIKRFKTRRTLGNNASVPQNRCAEEKKTFKAKVNINFHTQPTFVRNAGGDLLAIENCKQTVELKRRVCDLNTLSTPFNRNVQSCLDAPANSLPGNLIKLVVDKIFSFDKSTPQEDTSPQRFWGSARWTLNQPVGWFRVFDRAV